MRSLKIGGLFLLVLLITGACEKEGFASPGIPTQYSTQLMPITSVNGPNYAYPYEQIPIQVNYIVPADYSFIEFPSPETYSFPNVSYNIGVYASVPPVSNTADSYYVTDTYYFTATEPGWYYLNFLEPDGGYIQHVVTVY